MNITIGLVISYESEEAVEKCISAVVDSINLAKDLVHDFEILVIASSLWKNKRLSAGLPVKIIASDSNNIAKNRNLILKTAKFENIYFTDPDCTLTGATFRNILAQVQTGIEKNTFAIAGSNKQVSKNKKLDDFLIFLSRTKFLNLGSSQVKIFNRESMIWHAPTCNILYFKESIGNEEFDEKYYSYGEDLEFNYRLHYKLNKKILIVPNAEVIHHQPEASTKYYKKYFGYGMAQLHLLKSHPKSILNIRLLPIAAVVIEIVLMIAFGIAAALKILLAAVCAYLVAFVVESVLSKKFKLSWIAIHFAISIIYLSGQVYGLFTSKSKLTFDIYDNRSLGTE